jgi:hypothetical protein
MREFGQGFDPENRICKPLLATGYAAVRDTRPPPPKRSRTAYEASRAGTPCRTRECRTGRRTPRPRAWFSMISKIWPQMPLRLAWKASPTRSLQGAGRGRPAQAHTAVSVERISGPFHDIHGGAESGSKLPHSKRPVSRRARGGFSPQGKHGKSEVAERPRGVTCRG